MAKRLQSVTLELYGVQRSFEFDPPIEVPGDDDEMSIGRDILDEVTSTEVMLVPGDPATASVDIAFEYTMSGNVTVDLDLSTTELSSKRDLVDLIIDGGFDEVREAIETDITRYFDVRDAELDVNEASILFTDEDGEDFEF